MKDHSDRIASAITKYNSQDSDVVWINTEKFRRMFKLNEGIHTANQNAIAAFIQKVQKEE